MHAVLERCGDAYWAAADAGHVVDADNQFSVQANLMANEDVWPAMAKAYRESTGDLADRLVEALAEYLHRQVRREDWGYAADEDLDNRDLSLCEALEQAEYNRSEAARLLGISRRTLYRKLKRYREQGILPEPHHVALRL